MRCSPQGLLLLHGLGSVATSVESHAPGNSYPGPGESRTRRRSFGRRVQCSGLSRLCQNLADSLTTHFHDTICRPNFAMTTLHIHLKIVLTQSSALLVEVKPFVQLNGNLVRCTRPLTFRTPAPSPPQPTHKYTYIQTQGQCRPNYETTFHHGTAPLTFGELPN